MANILAVGIATLDIINIVYSYPQENEELRAIRQRFSRGGNATNTLVVLSQFGHHCHWAGSWVNEPDGQTILKDLKHYQIDTTWCHIQSQGKVPTSYITINQQNGSRTIVHYRNLPEFNFTDFQKIDLSTLDWLHFEGRNVPETLKMLQKTVTDFPKLPISLEVEKMRQDIEQLYVYANVLLFSKTFVHAYGYHEATSFLQHMHQQLPNTQLFCAWGEQGGYAIDQQGQIYHSPAHQPPQIIDTLGAGDTFNAGVIYSLCQHQATNIALKKACRLAGIKCSQEGFKFKIVPTL